MGFQSLGITRDERLEPIFAQLKQNGWMTPPGRPFSATITMSSRTRPAWKSSPRYPWAILVLSHYQYSLSPSCSCREGVVVALIAPAPGTGFPVLSNTVLFAMGGAKLARLRMLNASALNCTLDLSEIPAMGKFLSTAKSRFMSPGPIKLLRRRFPINVLG